MKTKKPSLKLKLIFFPLFILPRPLKKAVSYLWTCILMCTVKHEVSETKNRIRKAFPNKSEKEVNRIAFASIYNLILTLFELSYRVFGKKYIYKYTKVKNFDYLKECLNENRPVFLLSGHLSNFEIALSRLSYDIIKSCLIAKRIKNSFLDAILFESREISGLVHIPPKNALSDIRRCLKEKAPIFFAQDQHTNPPIGLKTTFLDLPAYTNSSLAKLALRNNALVIPFNIYREDNCIVIEIEKEIPFEKKFTTLKENVAHMTQVYNDWLSEKVTAKPCEWMWIYRRFKNPQSKGCALG